MAAVTTSPHGRPELKRELGLGMTTAMVVGNMIGSGVFLLPASLAAVVLVYGSSSLLAWVVTGVGAMLLAVVFATLGRRYPRTGGPYAYAREAFGEFVGFQTAWGYWIAAWVGNAAIATAFVGYVTVIWPDLGTTQIGRALFAHERYTEAMVHLRSVAGESGDLAEQDHHPIPAANAHVSHRVSEPVGEPGEVAER